MLSGDAGVAGAVTLASLAANFGGEKADGTDFSAASEAEEALNKLRRALELTVPQMLKAAGKLGDHHSDRGGGGGRRPVKDEQYWRGDRGKYKWRRWWRWRQALVRLDVIQPLALKQLWRRGGGSGAAATAIAHAATEGWRGQQQQQCPGGWW